MRAPVLYYKKRKQLRLYRKVEVLKERYRDREVYVRVDKPGYSLVVFFVKPSVGLLVSASYLLGIRLFARMVGDTSICI